MSTDRRTEMAAGPAEALAVTIDVVRRTGGYGLEVMWSPLGENDWHHVTHGWKNAPPHDVPCTWRVIASYMLAPAQFGESPRAAAGNHQRCIMLACGHLLEKLGAEVTFLTLPEGQVDP